MSQYWCLHCQRVFSVTEPPGRCVFSDCDGVGIGRDLYDLTRHRSFFDPWPAHWPAALEDGETYPLYLVGGSPDLG